MFKFSIVNNKMLPPESIPVETFNISCRVVDLGGGENQGLDSTLEQINQRRSNFQIYLRIKWKYIPSRMRISIIVVPVIINKIILNYIPLWRNWRKTLELQALCFLSISRKNTTIFSKIHFCARLVFKFKHKYWFKKYR